MVALYASLLLQGAVLEPSSMLKSSASRGIAGANATHTQSTASRMETRIQTTRRVATSVKTRTFGQIDAVKFVPSLDHDNDPSRLPFALVIHGAAASSVAEMEVISPGLARLGIQVVNLNLHAHAQLGARDCTPAQLNRALLEVVDSMQENVRENKHAELVQRLNQSRVRLLLGKSWGGAVAVRFAAAHPTVVQQLALWAPALHPSDVTALEEYQGFQSRSRVGNGRSVPVCVGWAEDDYVVPKLHRMEGLQQLSVWTVQSGGNHVALHWVDAAGALADCLAMGEA